MSTAEIELPQDEVSHLTAMFKAGRHVELEGQARLLIQRYPAAGIAWKALGVSLKMQGKDALAVFQKAAELLPDDAAAHGNLGAALIELGRLDDAAKSYRRAIEIAPGDAQAHLILGSILKDIGQLHEAEKCYRRTLEINPDFAEVHFNLGSVLQELGQLEDAVASYRRALTIKTDFAQAYYNMGIAMNELGRFDEVVQCYRQSLEIDPDDADAHYNLGNALKQLGQFDKAAASYRRALEIKPNFAKGHSNLGNVLQNLGRLDEAVASYRRALEIEPNFAEAHSNLGNALQHLDEFDEALVSCRQALKIKPDLAEAHNNLGAVLQELGQFDDAVASCRRALKIKPDFAEAYSNLGNALQDIGKFDEAVASCRRALEIKPDFAEAHSNLGNALLNIGELDEAVMNYNKAVEIKPDFAEAHYNLGNALLGSGKLAEGWHEYEYRRDAGLPKYARPATFLPQWIGQDTLPGDRLLVLEEQGFGDKLQFSRYLRLAEQVFPYGVSLVVARPLQSLLRRSFPKIEILDAVPANQSAWQWQCRLLSLPLAFNTVLETIPNEIPYLVPDPVWVAYWRSRIAKLNLPVSSLKIGLVWKPGSTMKNAALRSVTLQQLAPLFEVPNCSWFSLQKEPDNDKTPLVISGKIIDWAEDLNDFSETAALIENMDLVISVDTAVVHLAGALGCPTWMFNRHASEWRWMRNREDSPWYPQMRIFSQKIAGDWAEVVSRMLNELRGDELSRC